MNHDHQTQRLALAATQLLRRQTDVPAHELNQPLTEPWSALAADALLRLEAAARSRDGFIECNASLWAAVGAAMDDPESLDSDALERGFAQARLILCTSGGTPDGMRDNVISVRCSQHEDQRMLHVYSGIELFCSNDIELGSSNAWRLHGVQIAAYALSANFDGCVIDPRASRPIFLTREQLQRIAALSATTNIELV